MRSGQDREAGLMDIPVFFFSTSSSDHSVSCYCLETVYYCGWSISLKVLLAPSEMTLILLSLFYHLMASLWSCLRTSSTTTTSWTWTTCSHHQAFPRTPPHQTLKNFKTPPPHRHSCHTPSPMSSFSDLYNLPATGRFLPFWKNHMPEFSENRGTPTLIQPTDLAKYQAMLASSPCSRLCDRQDDLLSH